jgi:Matrixin/Carboxypeptidase regulatory-like domain
MAFQAKFLSAFLTLLIFSITVIADVSQFAEPTKATELRWKKASIPIVFSNSLLKPNPAIRPDSDIQGAIKRSLDAWEAVADVEFQVTWSDKLSVSPAGNSGDGTSLVTIAQTPENLLVFSGDVTEISARTRVFFNRRGEISEADIVLNPYQQFSTDGSIGTFDFESTLTHEIGHLLGLEHSSVIGATMNEHQGKNGVFNLTSFSPRTLSDDDITQIRAIYGAKNVDDCCGTIDGKITLSNGKAAKGFNVWLEESETGRVSTGSKVSADGSFLFKGLLTDKYRVFIQDSANNFGGQELGEIEVVKGKTTSLIKKITTSPRGFDVQFTGFNGQLSKLAIPINSGKSYLIYVGGKNLNPDDFKIGSTSPFITVSSGNLTKNDYGKDISVFSFEIKSATETPVGDYTIYLQNKDGAIEFLTGNLTVEKFVNPYNSSVFD